MIYVIGVDPGLRKTGLALVEVDGTNWRVLQTACVRPCGAGNDPSESIGRQCRAGSNAWRSTYQLDELLCVIEVPSYAGANVQSALAQTYLAGCIAGHIMAAGVLVQRVSPMDLKRALTESGMPKDAERKHKKAFALALAREHGLPEGCGDDEAEAALLGAMAIDPSAPGEGR